MGLASRLYRMSAAEIWHAVTLNAAAALCRGDRVGSIEVGKQADLVVWTVPSHEMVINRFGTNLVDTVVKAGRVVVLDGLVVRGGVVVDGDVRLR
jgi:imidazolonepropionase